MNAADAIIAKWKKKVERVDTEYAHHLEQGLCPKNAKIREKRDRDGKKAGSSSGWYLSYTLLNTPLNQVLMQIKDDSFLK